MLTSNPNLISSLVLYITFRADVIGGLYPRFSYCNDQIQFDQRSTARFKLDDAIDWFESIAKISGQQQVKLSLQV